MSLATPTTMMMNNVIHQLCSFQSAAQSAQDEYDEPSSEAHALLEYVLIYTV